MVRARRERGEAPQAEQVRLQRPHGPGVYRVSGVHPDDHQGYHGNFHQGFPGNLALGPSWVRHPLSGGRGVFQQKKAEEEVADAEA